MINTSQNIVNNHLHGQNEQQDISHQHINKINTEMPQNERINSQNRYEDFSQDQYTQNLQQSLNNIQQAQLIMRAQEMLGNPNPTNQTMSHPDLNSLVAMTSQNQRNDEVKRIISNPAAATPADIKT